jgi:perosamine synthetase
MVDLAFAPAPAQHGDGIPFTRTHICAEARQAVLEVLDSGWFTTGEQVLRF